MNNIYNDLFIDVTVVVFFCSCALWLHLSLDNRYSNYFLGLIFSLITIYIIQEEKVISEGQLHIFPAITMTISGFIGGPASAIIAAIISSLYQYYMFGSSSISGIITTIVFASLGYLLGTQFKNNHNPRKRWFGLLIGIFISCMSLLINACMAKVHLGSFVINNYFDLFMYIISSCLATTLIFIIYFRINALFRDLSILNTLMNSSSLDLIIFDKYGPIQVSNHLKSQPQYNQYIESVLPIKDPDFVGEHNANPQHNEIECEDGRNITADLLTSQMPSGDYTCIGIVNDVTDRKRALEMHKRAKERFSKAFQSGPLMMTLNSKPKGHYIDVNHRFLETRGFKYEDVIGKTPVEIGVPEKDYNRIIALLETKGSVENYESSIATQTGPKGTCIISAVEIQIDDQECILFFYNDITEIKRMQTESIEQLTERIKLEADLSQSNQLIADIINNMPDAFYVLDNEWRFTFVNKKVEELLLTRQNLLNKVFWDINPQARGTLFDINFHKAKNNGLPITFETPSFLRKNTWYQVAAYPSEFGLSVYYRDISKRKLADEKLIEAQKETVNILESMTDCFFAINNEWLFTYINRVGEVVYGMNRNELIGKKITEIFSLEELTLRNFHQVMTQKVSMNFEVLSKTLDNIWVEINAYPTETGLIAYFHDITSRKITEQEIARLDRLNLVGQLAAGIGHEIRNPMTTVRGYLQLLGTKPDYAAQKSTFELMISELDRANSIITEFLSLSQTKQSELQLQNLNDILNNLYPLLEADAFTQNKQISFQLGDIPDLELNGKEITQLILNLTRNGLESMAKRGCLTVKTYPEQDKVILSIQDEGCGIPKEHLKKLGTPFFTTKDKGTGLGLATCYRIAESHNAIINIETNPTGTTFLILFPIPQVQEQE